MSSEIVPISKSRGWVRLLIAFVVAFDVAAFFQWADGAFQSEFGAHPDEATHYLTGLRVRDAALHMRDREQPGAVLHPVAALRRTPVFDLAQGAWMLVFGTSRLAAMLFLTTLAAATATLIFGAVRREFSDWAALVGALLWLCAPAIRESYETILPELSDTFLMMAAALLCARWLDAAYTRWPAPRHWSVRSLSWIGPGVLAFAIIVILKNMHGDPHTVWAFVKSGALNLGIAVAIFSVFGIVIRRRAEVRPSAIWITMLAFIAGVLVARCLQTGLSEVRVLIVATPALAMLATRGAVALGGIVGSRKAIAGESSRREVLWIFLLLLLAFPQDFLSPMGKDWHGFAPIADALLAESRGTVRVLVVSDSRGEGMLISEVAMRDPERQISIERGSTTLVDSTGTAPGGKPLERFLEDEQLLAHLTAGRIRYIVFDSAVPQEVRAGYHDQMLRVLEGNVRNFWPLHTSPLIRDGEPQGHPLRIFRVMQPDDPQLQ